MLDDKSVIEALLLCSEDALSVERMIQIFASQGRTLSSDQISALLQQVSLECEHRGIELVRLAGGYRYQSRKQLAPWLQMLRPVRKPRITRAQLEVITIIAYQQPVTRGDIEKIRGIGTSSELIAHFLRREWIQPKGTLDAPGNPTLYCTTQKFLEYFQMDSLEELPKIEDEIGMPLPFADANAAEQEKN